MDNLILFNCFLCTFHRGLFLLYSLSWEWLQIWGRQCYSCQFYCPLSLILSPPYTTWHLELTSDKELKLTPLKPKFCNLSCFASHVIGLSVYYQHPRLPCPLWTVQSVLSPGFAEIATIQLGQMTSCTLPPSHQMFLWMTAFHNELLLWRILCPDILHTCFILTQFFCVAMMLR